MARARSSRAPENKSIRVIARVRPVLHHEKNSAVSSLTYDTTINSVGVVGIGDKPTHREFQLDSVFGSESTQEQVYERAGVQDFVQSVVDGFHSTIFAYGQTGSGKTFTMEGFKYVVPPAKKSGTQPNPVADFGATPPDHLGIIPRAVRALFDAARAHTDRRVLVRCSFVQIYKEQAYDLLNPTSLVLGVPGASPGPNAASGGALRMRWSKSEDFYLENLFKVECGGPDEVLEAFKMGVSNKVMASHKLNASSSRSHCLFTIYVDSSPLAAPQELTSSRLTLVDLAGSERAAATGATKGQLREESIFINKSLFMLRKVIMALTEATAQPGTAHIPYRDSKLTCLLKNSLGGSSLAMMIACLAPCDEYRDENLSTLEYAARAKCITNQVEVNEDPKTKLIRELRAEVEFLRSQLAQLRATPGLSLEAPALTHTPPKQAAAPPAARPPPASKIPTPPTTAPAAPVAAASGDAGEAALPAEWLAGLANSTVEVLAQKLLEAVRLVQSLSSTNQGLRAVYERVARGLEDKSAANDSLMIENAQLRDRLSLYEGLVAGTSQVPGRPGGAGQFVGEDGRPSSSPSAAALASMYTPQAATLIELSELRRENAYLHQCLQRSASESRISTGPPSSSGRGSPANTQAPGRSLTRSSSAGPGRRLSGGAAAGSSSASSLPQRTLSPQQLKAVLEGASSKARSAPAPLIGGGGGGGSIAGGYTAQRRGMTAGPHRGGPSDPPERVLADYNSQLATRALSASVRVSTTGQLLPGAVISRTSPGGQNRQKPSTPPLSGSAHSSDMLSSPPHTSPSSSPNDIDPAHRLTQLMSARSALARSRLDS